MIWKVVCGAWVVAPILGYWPGTSPRHAQMGWWVLASILVCAVGMRQPVRQQTSLWAWGLVGCVAVFASHLTSIGWAVAWLYQVTLILLAAWLIHERGEWTWLKNTILGVGLFQGVVVLWQLLGGPTPYWSWPGGWLTGTLSARAALSILWGACSLLSHGRVAWGFALLACLTGSFAGSVPAVGRLLGQSRTIPMTWPIGAVGVLLLSHRLWWPRLLGRWQAMESLEFLQRGWVTGWGFLPFPGGWQSIAASGRQAGLVAQLDYHNVFVDWIARTGMVGGLGLLALVWWVSKRLTSPWRRWTAFLALWAGSWQSAEAFPVMTLLGLVWLMGLAQEAEC